MALEFLEDYLATVDNLPSEIRHHFSELKEKDILFQDLRRQIFKETQGLQKTPATDANVQREDDIARNIGLEYGQARVLVDEKIDIADRTLALLESHIRRLDGELQRMQFDFDAPLLVAEEKEQPQYEMDDFLSMFTSAQASATNQYDLQPISYASPANPNRDQKRKAPIPGSKVPSNKKRRRDDDWEEDAYFDGFLKAEEEEFEEPIYCTCQRVSFGEMVGCDNPAGCPFGEWFHLECVGLREPPKGSWVCPQCRTTASLYTNAGYPTAKLKDQKKRKH